MFLQDVDKALCMGEEGGGLVHCGKGKNRMVHF